MVSDESTGTFKITKEEYNDLVNRNLVVTNRADQIAFEYKRWKRRLGEPYDRDLDLCSCTGLDEERLYFSGTDRDDRQVWATLPADYLWDGSWLTRLEEALKEKEIEDEKQRLKAESEKKEKEAAKEERERKKYERLKAKYGDKN